MKKIPTIFEREWKGDRKILPNLTKGCEWFSGGPTHYVATRKHDGTCCLVMGGELYKRYTVRPRKKQPEGFIIEDSDPNTGKLFGWVKVDDGPSDKFHRMAFESQSPLEDGTYELCGPKIQGNPEGLDDYTLIRHGSVLVFVDAGPMPTTFDQLKEYFENDAPKEMEGIVFWKDGKPVGKVKRKDFQLEEKTNETKI